MIEVNGEIDKEMLEGVVIPRNLRLAKFRRTNYVPLKKITENGIKEQNTASLAIPLEFTGKRIRDEKSAIGEMVQIRHYRTKSESTFNGNKQVVYEPNSILIDGEFLVLDLQKPENRELYKVLMLHPLEKTNAEMYGKIPMFEYYDPQADAKKENATKVRKAKAISLVYDEDKITKSLAEKLHKFLYPTNTKWTDTRHLIEMDDHDTIRQNLAEYAEKEPEAFEKLVGDYNIGLRAEIKEAVDAKVLEYTDRQWLWYNTKKNRNNKLIVVVPVGEDEVTELVTFFVTNKKDGKPALDALRDELKAVKDSEA